MVEEQEYHHDGHERSKCQSAACCLLAFELSAVFDVVSFRQFDLCVYLGLYIIDYTSQVAVGHVGGDDDFTLYILAADGVRTHGRADFRYIVQWNFLSVARINHQVAYFFHFVAQVVFHAYG